MGSAPGVGEGAEVIWLARVELIGEAFAYSINFVGKIFFGIRGHKKST